MKKIRKAFWEHVCKYRFLWILTGIFAAVCQGYLLLGNTVGIDTEAQIVQGKDFFGSWLENGRQGLVLLKFATGSYRVFLPYASGILTILFLTLACVLWTFLFAQRSGQGEENRVLSFGIFSFLLCSSPILTEQFYFKLQAVEISLAFCLMAIALELAWNFGERGSLRIALGAILLLLILFASYQAMNAMFLFGMCASFSLYYWWNDSCELTTKKIWKFVGRVTAIFLAAFGVNQVVTSLFFSESQYLNYEMGWGNRPVAECLSDLLRCVGRVVLGTKSYFPKTYVVFLCCILIYTLRKTGKKGKASGWGLGLMSVILWIISPFFLNLVIGGDVVVRAWLVYPFMFASVGYALCCCLQSNERAVKKILLLCLVSYTCFVQMKFALALCYTDAVRYQSDVRMAERVMERLDELEDEERTLPVVFVGKREADLNPSCVRGDLIGASFFAWDTYAEPPAYFSSGRILGFLECLGVKYPLPGKEECEYAVEQSENMPNFPVAGSVERFGELIVVKLSDFENAE